MDVCCENCGTEYDFDEAQLRGAASKVKCTRCGFQFKVYRRMADAPDAARREVGPAGWMLRSPEGNLHRVADVGTLRAWILEGRVGRDFELSDDGILWRAVGEVTELGATFQQREQLASRGGTERSLADAERPRGAVGVRGDVGSISVAETPLDGPRPGGGMARPLSALDLELDEDELTLATRSLVKQTRTGRGALGLLLVGAVALGAVVVGVLRWRAHGGSSVVGSESFRGGREAFEIGSDEQLRRAREQLDQARQQGPDDPLLLAALSEVATATTLARREDARELEAAGSASADAAEAARSRAEAESRRLEAGVQLGEAKAHGFRALGLAPSNHDVTRAWAYYLVADGAPVQEVERFLTLARSGGDNADLDLVEAALYEREGDLAKAWWLVNRAVQRSSDQLGQPYPRALYTLARLALEAGRADEARAVLNRLLALSPGHTRAARLLVRAGRRDGAPSAAAVAPSPPVGASGSPAAPGAPAETPPVGAGAGPAADGTPPPPAVASLAAVAPIGGKGSPPPARGGAAASPSSGGEYGELVAQGDSLSEQGRSREAEKRYVRALSLRPDGVEATVGLAYVLLDLGRTEQAIARFRQAVELSPRYGEAILGLAEAYRTKGNATQAVESYRRYLQVLPTGPKAKMAAQNLRELGAEPGATSGRGAASGNGGTEASGGPSPAESAAPPSGGDAPSDRTEASPGNPPVVTGSGSGDTPPAP
jgi:predicted Zn finger-like uncharacterized protein